MLFYLSVTKALADAGISYDKIEQACVGYVYGKIMWNMLTKAQHHFYLKLMFHKITISIDLYTNL